MAATFTEFHAFTIRCEVKGSGRSLARLLDAASDPEALNRDSAILLMPVEDGLRDLPRYQVRDGKFVFEVLVPKDRTAEQVHEQFVAELAVFGFKP